MFTTTKKERDDTINRFKSGKIRSKGEISMIQTIKKVIWIDYIFGDAINVDFVDRRHRTTSM